jgi:hypothetical protein
MKRLGLAAAAALLVLAALYVVHGRAATAALATVGEATLEVLPGAESVTVHSTALGDELYRASTLPGSPVRPKVRVDGSRVAVGLTGAGVAGQAAVHVFLNNRVRWRVVLAGGGLEQAVDFGSGRLAALEVRAGSGRVDLTLPRPEGTLQVRVAGGAGALTVHLPSAVPMRLSLDDVGTLTVDGAVKHDKAFTDAGWPAATDRLDLRAAGGVAQLTLDRVT